MNLLQKVLRSEPVVLIAGVLVLVMVVQKLWLGEVITQDWVEWVLGLFGVTAGAHVVRKNVYSKKTVEGEHMRMEDHG